MSETIAAVSEVKQTITNVEVRDDGRLYRPESSAEGATSTALLGAKVSPRDTARKGKR